MYRPAHPHDGLTLSGNLRISPRLDSDAIERLDAIASASLRAAIDDKPSTFVDALAPGHPDGPNPWVVCNDGCCLDVGDSPYVRVDAIEPWLSYLVGTMLTDHTFSGALMFWDHADRTFTALTIDGTHVRREAILRRKRRGSARARRDGSGLRPVESV